VKGHTRRHFLQSSVTLIGASSLAGCGAPPFQWQQPRLVRIGILSLGTPASTTTQLEALRGGLRDLGYVDGQTIILEPRFAEGRPEQHPELVAELVRLDVSAIVANEPPAVLAARRDGGAIPIVMAGASELTVERGLVASLARPGGTVTGLTYGTPQLAAKRLQLLKEAVPSLARVAFINDPTVSPIAANPKVGVFRTAAEALGLPLEVVEQTAPEGFADLFADLGRARVEGFFIDGSPVTFAHRLRLSELATRHRLPSI